VGELAGSGPRSAWPASDERRHADVAVEEWAFSFWTPDGDVGGVVWLRHHPPARTAWYWSALVRAGHPLLHVTEWAAPLPSAGLALRAESLWADHVCESPFEQWTVANEAYAVALDDPADALGAAFGGIAPMAFDLEWYAAGPPEACPGGYAQRGEVHGVIELGDGALELDGQPAARSHRWGAELPVLPPPPAWAHRGLRAPVRFPDGALLDLVLTPDGWRSRAPM